MVSALKQELQIQSWLPSVAVGLIMGVTMTLTEIIPMAALVFSGQLEPFLPTGISITLLSAAIVGIVLALRSSFVGLLAFPVAEQVTILGTMAAAIARSMSAASSEEVLLTIVAAIVVSSLLTGAFLYILGRFKLGELIRFLPYPVVGGFLAGLGYLITAGSIHVLTRETLSWVTLGSFLQGDMVLRWVPSLIFAVLLLVMTRRYHHFAILPGSMAAAIALFYLVLFLTHTSIAQALQTGWLLGPFPENHSWKPFSAMVLTQANWSAIVPQLGSIAALMLITALSLLLISSSLELITERDMDLNRELEATGIACLLSGLLGGMVGSHAITSMLVEKMGGKSRLVGVVVALIYLIFLLVGVSFLTFFPKPVLGGLLMFTGLDLLAMQLYDGWFKLPKTDYGIVLLIMAIVVMFGFVVGVVVGLVIAIILFALNYSRVSVARYSRSGASLSSHRKRPPNQERMLHEEGEKTHVLTLQGFIFFGTANQLFTQIRQRVHTPNLPALQFLVLDFRLVTGLDSSAVVSFVKLKQLARKQDFRIVFADVLPVVEKPLRQGGVVVLDDPQCKVVFDLDRAMEWCENQLLEASKYRRTRFLPMVMQLKTYLTADSNQVSTLMKYLELMTLEVNDYLFHQGDAATALYFIESGEMSTLMSTEGKDRRVQTLGAGTTVGEVEFYTQVPYKVAAIADKPTRLYRLSSEDLQRMQQEQPEVAAIFSNWMNGLLANRLTYLQQEITSLTC
ncbi:cyclic nucleotide-binding domain-containing protein (plasmid) [Kovacikia minuta CCNUW1]|uniref:SulP family inorganic anion transporter n=1 Tax=Kovacikia minuta TaxID=2931930 RepID=UPI001CCE216D|nr:SulP family inorganic anion transporter [Kovacikia minuta]UBF30414.1 cyclic nucleotide-binding domain-containing protein [Kovacikia minuta CCNUW1]